jgi:hypothetical protein
MSHDATDYEVMIEQLDKSIDIMMAKIDEGRIRDPDKEKVRVQYHKALKDTIQTRLDVVEQRDLHDMAETIEELKANHATA